LLILVLEKDGPSGNKEEILTTPNTPLFKIMLELHTKGAFENEITLLIFASKADMLSSRIS